MHTLPKASPANYCKVHGFMPQFAEPCFSLAQASSTIDTRGGTDRLVGGLTYSDACINLGP
jgi:hypothetical protein